MMKIMLVIKNVGLDLATAVKQFALSVIVYRKITERKEIGYYAILVKLHLVKWNNDSIRYVMLQLFLNIFMFIEVAILNIRHFSCTLYVLTHFTLVTFFLSLRKCVSLLVSLRIFLRKYKECDVLEFMLRPHLLI